MGQAAALPGFFRFEQRLNVASDLADVLRQASDGFSAVRFILDAVETG